MGDVVGLRGRDVFTAGEPREDVIQLAEWLLEAAKAGEVVGLHTVFVYRDECTGARQAGWESYAVAGRLDSLKMAVIESLGES